MKQTTIYISLLTLMFISVPGTYSLFAKDHSASVFKSIEKEKLNTIIVDAVKYPAFSLSKEERGEISVTFSLTDEGMIKVEQVAAPSKRIEDYVKDQLSDVSAKDVLHFYNQKFSVKFRFENC